MAYLAYHAGVQPSEFGAPLEDWEMRVFQAEVARLVKDREDVEIEYLKTVAKAVAGGR